MLITLMSISLARIPYKRSRRATRVRGVDDYGHCDPDCVPRFNLDPLSMRQLSAAWGEHKDGEVRQAADMAEQ